MTRDYLDILQITDIHFCEKVDGTIYGVETQSLFEKTLAQIQDELKCKDKSEDAREVDVLLVTGDISQDGSGESYRRFHEMIAAIDSPTYFLQGNHDYAQPMIEQFGQQYVAPRVLSEVDFKSSPWRIILLNSSVEDQVGGHFGKEQLAFLEQALKADSESPTMLCFHHHPMRIDCEWLDKQMIDDAQDFFNIIDGFSNIKLCVYGHVHQDRLTIRKRLPFYASPSTCVQFKPEVKDFSLDDKAAGYRWIRCFDNGQFETTVHRLKDFDFPS